MALGLDQISGLGSSLIDTFLQEQNVLSVNSRHIADLHLEVSAHGSQSEMSIIMYIEYIEKFLNRVKKTYAKLFKQSLTPKKPIRKKSAPQKRKPNKKNN